MIALSIKIEVERTEKEKIKVPKKWEGAGERKQRILLGINNNSVKKKTCRKTAHIIFSELIGFVFLLFYFLDNL